jgi:hypothetical protein
LVESQSGDRPGVISSGGLPDLSAVATPGDMRGEAAKPGNGAGEAPPPGSGHELSFCGDDGGLPPRERRDVLSISEAHLATLEMLNSSLVRREQDGATHKLTLPGQSAAAEFTVEDDGDRRVVRNWRITVDPEVRDTGLGKRLADASVDDFVYSGVHQVEVELKSEVAQRIVAEVFGNAISYEILPAGTASTSQDGPLTHADALQILRHREAAADGAESVAGYPAGIRAIVDLEALVATRPDLAIMEHERVIDRCDFSTPTVAGPSRRHWDYIPDPATGELIKTETREPGYRHGESVGFLRRCAVGYTSQEERDNLQLVAGEHLANYRTHVAPKEPGVSYRVRRSEIFDPATGTTKTRLASYFYGNVDPRTAAQVHAELSGGGLGVAGFAGDSAIRGLVGRTRDESDRAVEAMDQKKQMGAESLAARVESARGDLTGNELHALQRSGRGFAMINAVTSLAVWRGLRPQGGMFVYDILPYDPVPAPDPRLGGADLDAAISALGQEFGIEDEDWE